MKICYLTRSLDVKIGGLDRYSCEVIDRIHRKEGVETVALVEKLTNKPYEKAVLKNVSGNFWQIFYNIFVARKEIKNCDVIHAMDLFPYGLIAVFANIGFKKKLIINGVGTDSVVRLDRLILGTILKWAYKQADKVLCISEYTRKRILKKVPGLKNLEVVYLGVEYEKFTNHPHLTSPIKGVEQERGPILVGVGQPKRRKGYHVAIRALGKLKEKYPNFLYYIVGLQAITKYVEQLKQLATDSGISDNVVFLENISDKHLIVLYHIADLFLLPSVNIGQHFEGFGLVFLEAASAGLPGIGTKNCGIEEAVKNGQTGILVEQENVEETATAIDKLLSDKELREKMGREAKKFAATMNWSVTVKKYLSYYQF
ncbi:MAG: hypothetical protein COT91_04645 [Candidatus Doudnabacteria bacterium CG10_big_fil_rev_8_21_14_0_10_41_10]|uniref:Glycosyltransferase family 1 protein n=1 Tax=Candidatus Doudnabacteria bacterium CG10_big_fil_rev_8_21_14_0_10_41_10 TaxID=1974551 RepID=A0A2H0VCI6_9BACT|nr:MAG: hypothetical protein COT91_04645 [Candidatus Doudnabacteria bacterium CG10_big_fil_rev_8_21_14_0_10_41_10]